MHPSLAVRRKQQNGFVMPLAITGVLVLALSGLSLEAAVLQERHRYRLAQQEQQHRDHLASAAQLWAAWLKGPGQCLRDRPSSQWQKPLPLACPVGLDPQAMDSMTLDGVVVRLVAWEPETGSAGTLQLLQAERDGRFGLGDFGVRELG